MSVRVYWLDCREVDPESPRVWALMSRRRQQRLSQISTVQGRRQSAAAELALVMAMACERSGADQMQSLSQVEWRPLPGGKPVIGEGGLHFCLAHAGDLAVCAVSEAPVGIDVEPMRNISPGMRRKIFSAAEQQRSDGDMLWTWVAKESYIKLTGEGLRRSMTGFSATEGEIVDGNGRRLAWLRTLPLEWPDYTMCVCAQQAQPVSVRRLYWNRGMGANE